jgi:hypothetical protein
MKKSLMQVWGYGLIGRAPTEQVQVQTPIKKYFFIKKKNIYIYINVCPECAHCSSLRALGCDKVEFCRLHPVLCCSSPCAEAFLSLQSLLRFLLALPGPIFMPPALMNLETFRGFALPSF